MNLDPAIKRLVEALNNVPELYTTSSCAGHKNPKEGQKSWGMFYVDFSVPYTAGGWEALERIACFLSEWQEENYENITVTPWYDGGLRWSLEGEYTNQEQIDFFAEIVEKMEFIR